MAYPNGTPGTNVGDIYTGTVFTATNNVRSIRDGYTSLDRASLSNSLGTELALVQNFVNSTYLGRSGVPVGTAYMTTEYVDTFKYSHKLYVSYAANTSITPTSSQLEISSTTDNDCSITLSYGSLPIGTVLTVQQRANGLRGSAKVYGFASPANIVMLHDSACQFVKTSNGWLTFNPYIVGSPTTSLPSGYISQVFAHKVWADHIFHDNGVLEISGANGVYSPNNLYTSGRFGVGTAAPQSELEVYRSFPAYKTSYTRMSVGPYTMALGIDANETGGDPIEVRFSNYIGGGRTTFWNTSVVGDVCQRMSIDWSGRVCIGINSDTGDEIQDLTIGPYIIGPGGVRTLPVNPQDTQILLYSTNGTIGGPASIFKGKVVMDGTANMWLGNTAGGGKLKLFTDNTVRFELGYESQIWMKLVGGANLTISGIPTSDPGAGRRVWSDGGTLKITNA